MTRGQRIMVGVTLAGAVGLAGSGLVLDAAWADIVPAKPAIGLGIDTVSAEVKGECLEPFAALSSPTPGGQSIVFESKLIETADELATNMGVDLAGSVKVGAVGGDARVSWVRERQVNAYSLYLSVTVLITNEAQRIPGPQLRRDWAEALGDGTEAAWRNFRRSCGDQFVVGSVTGATFRAVYELRTRSESERESIKSTLSAAGLTGAWSASASFSSAMEKVSHMTNIQAVVFADVPQGMQTIPQTPNEITAFAAGLPGWMRQPGRGTYTIDWMVASYDILKMPSQNPFRADRQRQALADLSRRQNEALGFLNSIQYARLRPADFDLRDADEARLAALDKSLRQDLDTVYTLAADCYQLLASCSNASAPDITRFARQMPKRKPTPNAPGACSLADISDRYRFASVGGGCMDLSSGTVWSATAAGQMPLDVAEQYCSQLAEGGVGGWRLPTAAEVASVAGPTLAGKVLVGVTGNWFWTADRRRADPIRGSVGDMDPRFSLSVICRRENTGT